MLFSILRKESMPFLLGWGRRNSQNWICYIKNMFILRIDRHYKISLENICPLCSHMTDDITSFLCLVNGLSKGCKHKVTILFRPDGIVSLQIVCWIRMLNKLGCSWAILSLMFLLPSAQPCTHSYINLIPHVTSLDN